MATDLLEPASATEGQYGVEAMTQPPSALALATAATAPMTSSRTAFQDLERSVASGERATADARAAVAESQAAQRAALEAKAAAVNPQIEAGQRGMEELRAAVVASPRPASPEIPAPPSRGLRAFLTPTENQTPETSIQQFVGGIGLLATMVGGVASGSAVTSLAALKGAMQGWAEGDKERADRSFADWKASTDTLLAQHDRQVADWDAWFKNSSLSVDMMLKGASLEALKHDNVLAAQAFQTGSLKDALTFLDESVKAGNTIRTKMAEILSSRELNETQRAAIEEHRKEALAQQERMRLAEIASRESIAAANLEARREAAADRRADKAAQIAAGAKTPVELLKDLNGLALGRTQLAEMKRLAPTVRMDKIVGGINPWLAQIDATGRIGPIPLPKGLLQSFTDDERRMLALAENYADRTLRDRSGAAVTDSEFVRMLRFLVSGASTPAAFAARLQLQEDLSVAEENIIRQGLSGASYRAPVIQAQPLNTPKMRIRPIGGGPMLEGPEGPIPPGYERVP